MCLDIIALLVTVTLIDHGGVVKLLSSIYLFIGRDSIIIGINNGNIAWNWTYSHTWVDTGLIITIWTQTLNQ